LGKERVEEEEALEETHRSPLRKLQQGEEGAEPE